MRHFDPAKMMVAVFAKCFLSKGGSANTAALWVGRDNCILLFKVVIGCSRLLTRAGEVPLNF
jgi:hypothetical protein